MAKTNKKNSAKRKLIPAVSMLTVSAVMLSTATYAWFTMSREVEVKNIQMTATVPEDIQISLGHLYKDSTNDANGAADASLSSSTGILHGASSADNCGVDAPSKDWDWSNTADISAYYQIGKLIPASSTNGAAIFFTPDADGVGKTVKEDAKYIKASGVTPGGTGVLENDATVGGTSSSTDLRATLHAYTGKTGAAVTDTWYSAGGDNDYKTATAYNATKDDGYYVDIPVWIRTSSVSGAQLSVQAYVKPKTETQTNNTAGEALYRAVRVAILDPGQTDPEGATDAQKSTVTASNLLPVADGWTIKTATTEGELKANPFSGGSVLNWYNGTKDKNVAVKAAGTLNKARNDSAIYGAATEYTADATVAKLGAGTGTEYGAPAKLIIRVWLEGEDPDCWNETAGQDWSINLKFNNKTATASNGDISSTATTPTQP